MKTFKIDNKPKINTGFTVPENYFEDFSTKMMQQLPAHKPKIISFYAMKKTWMYSAAAILVLTLLVPVYTNYCRRSPEIDDTTIENYITDESTVSTIDLANLLNEQDIQKISNDLHIADIMIENELSENKNLELYLLN